MNLQLLEALIEADPASAILLIKKHKKRKFKLKNLDITGLCLKLYNEEFDLNVKFKDLQTKNRNRLKVVLPRQILHYIYNIYTLLTLNSIGKSIGNKTHATVLNSIKTVNNLIETDKQIRILIKKIERILDNE